MMKTLSLTAWMTLFAVAAGGCGLWNRGPGDTPERAFRTDRLVYATGGEATLILRNVYEEPIGYNLCSSQLEREEEDGWTAVQEDRICTRELRVLEPGRTDSFAVELAADLPEGTYRYATALYGTGPAGEPPDNRLTTNAFRVERR